VGREVSDFWSGSGAIDDNPGLRVLVESTESFVFISMLLFIMLCITWRVISIRVPPSFEAQKISGFPGGVSNYSIVEIKESAPYTSKGCRPNNAGWNSSTG
jgi:hypothetical protein